MDGVSHRQQRLEREKAEKEARHKQKKAQLNEAGAADKPAAGNSAAPPQDRSADQEQ